MLDRSKAAVSLAVDASNLQVLTREGRHLSGVALTDAQITELMTAANGFDAGQCIMPNI